MYVFLLVHVINTYIYRGQNIYRGQKRAPDPLEQELQVVMSHPKWVLAAKPRYFTRTTSKSQNSL